MIHKASEWVWGVSECLGGAHAWIQLGTHSKVTQTWQERSLLWEQDANYYAQCDVGYCRVHTLSQRQYQANFCLKECHVNYPPWKLLWVIPTLWRRCISGQSTQGTAAAPWGWSTHSGFPDLGSVVLSEPPCQHGARAVSCWGELEGDRHS